MKQKPKESLNELTPKEWAKLSRSVWSSSDLSPPRKWYQLEHGSTFPEPLAERVIKIYTKKGDLVLDPFLGIGTTLIAASRLGRRGIGIELYEKFVNIAKELLNQQTPWEYEQKVIHGDCRNLLEWVEPNSVQLMFTSPPYANFIRRSIEKRRSLEESKLIARSFIKPYGDDPRDFGNLPYEKFLLEIKELMKKLFIVTKPGGYNVWVARDYRDTRHGKPFIPFHSDLARIGEEVGFVWHDLIIWDQNQDKVLNTLGYPSVFYVNINHTFLVVLRKPPENLIR